MAELLYERSGIALETTSGTPVAAPTHFLPVTITLTPNMDTYLRQARGIRAQNSAGTIVHQWTDWEMPDTGLDTYTLPVLLNAAVAANSSPTTPTSGVLTRLWTFSRSQTSTTEKTLTLFGGDPNVQSFQVPYGVVDSLTISANAASTDAATMAMSGRGQIMTAIANPTYPTMLQGPLVTPLQSQLWIDTATIGTTAITGRVISTEFSVDGLRGDPKYLFAGPTASKTFNRFGASQTQATLALRFEFPDTVQFVQAQNGTLLKTRVRFNGPAIETVAGPLTYYQYVEVDFYGMVTDIGWGEEFGTNRTLDLTLTSIYDATAGTDWSIKVQNDRTTL